jgi:hypothetical protein
MRKRFRVLAVPLLAAGLSPAAFTQGGAQTQPTDPTAQAPTTPAPGASASASSAAAGTMFSGSIVREKSAYVLKTGNTVYNLDDQDKAKEHKGKNVKVTGSLDKSTNTIHVEKIEAATAM